MKTIQLFLCFLLNTYLIYAQTYNENPIIPKLKDSEFYQVESMIVDGEPRHSLTIYITNDFEKKSLIVFKDARSHYIFSDKKSILIMADSPTYGDRALYYIDGSDGRIEYLGNFQMGFAIFEKERLILSRTVRQTQMVSPDILLFDIDSRCVVWFSDMNSYIIDHISLQKKEFYEIDFPGNIEGKIETESGVIKVWFSQYGEDGSASFYRNLRVIDKNTIKWLD